MKTNFFKIASVTAIVFSASQAHAAYVCELYDRAANAPGGDTPAAKFYSDTSDFAVAKAACSGKVDRHNFIDYWLKWTSIEKLPGDWRESDLLASSTTPAPAPQLAPTFTK